MKFGDLSINGKVFLAPMAGITDLPFRIIAKKHGASLSYSEMVSAKGLLHNNIKTQQMLNTKPEPLPVAVQIFGSEPDIIAEIVERLNDSSFALIDINMGCPAPKIVKNGEGCALMRNPKLVGEIVHAAVKVSKKPITIKIRKGFGELNAIEVAKTAEYSGASAVTIHGRTREQFYAGSADWEIIRELKRSVSIPVIGNGDICSAYDAKRMLEETACDAVMIGRAACGNPWLFNECNEYLLTGFVPAPPTVEEKMLTANEHFRLMIEFKGEHLAILEMRRQLSYYLKGLQNSSAYRQKAVACTDSSQIFELINDIKQEYM